MSGYEETLRGDPEDDRCHGSAVDVVCLGETMLMFAPPRYELIEHCDIFRVYNGGAESNVAIGLERLGVHAAWISKLPKNALGRKVVHVTRAYGVDTSRVIWTETGRVGLFFVEFGAPPRPHTTLYDRAHSAFATLEVEELDWAFLSQAKLLHLTGITPALGELCRRTTIKIVERARAIGIRVSFDVNYRSLLWTPAEARAALEEILPCVNLLIATQADAALLLGEEAEPRPALQRLRERYGCDVVVLTLGSEGSMAFDGQAFYRGAAYALQEVNRLGAGDAFDAGLIYGWLRSDVQVGLDYGGAMAALKHTVPQNIPLLNKDDVEGLIRGTRVDILR